ncbi:MAG: hypothetical protein HY744_32170 [Deltaproteobacteria bacterium]|nr:hypothetical protein [Deltaproteobacteria bacterium]
MQQQNIAPRWSATWQGLSLAALSCALFACSAADEPECRSGADCASGACHDGACVPAQTSSGGSGGGAGGAGQAGAGGAAGGGAEGGAGAGGGGGGPEICSPNQDGTIERGEVPLQAGLKATFKVALDATVSTAGTPQPDGSRLWDLSQLLPGDHLVLVELQPLEGKWFASLFPGASYAALLSDTEPLYGVFEIGAKALLLRGVVSPEAGLTRTELVYDPPVAVLDFPLAQGKSWKASTTVSGLAQGIYALYTENYTYEVDAHGKLSTPFADFAVLRARVTLERWVGVVKTTIRSHLFVAECFGTVATVVSHDNEASPEFEQAAEVRRLAP